MNVVVTGGATIAPIDDVRYVTNVSSGRFSAQITEALLNRGARVWHIHGPNAVLPFQDRARFRLDTDDLEAEFRRLTKVRDDYEEIARDSRLKCLPMGGGTVSDYAKVLREVLTSESVNMAILAMAVSDYEPVPEHGKISSDRGQWTLRFDPTPKVIQLVRDWTPSIFLVGFKLLHGVSAASLIETARRATISNRADLTVANDLQQKLREQHTVHLVNESGLIETLSPEPDLASRLASRLIAHWRTRTEAR